MIIQQVTRAGKVNRTNFLTAGSLAAYAVSKTTDQCGKIQTRAENQHLQWGKRR